jgi:HEAT repeat protein
MTKLTSRGILKVIEMSIKRLCLIAFVLVIGCQQTTVSSDKKTDSTFPMSFESESQRQLKINRSALLEGPNEQIRVDAATILLHSSDSQAREVLLDALKQSQNVAAQTAVCKALNQARSTREPIKNKNDFIQPLFGILVSEDSGQAKLAAEAMLIFEYDQIAKQLENAANDGLQPVKSRLNMIYALRLQPDMRAIITLIKLLDDPEKQISAEAEKAVQSLGIPVGRNAQARKQIISELKRKGRNAFLRDWMLRQEEQIKKLETEADSWQKLYLSSLDKIYDGLGTDVAKSRFLAEQLADSRATVKLWAIDKISQWRVGTKSKMPTDEIGPVLVGLVSNENREIRLKTAKLLSLMGELNSAEKLLEQLKIEQDDEIKTELFVALGGACYYAFLPNSGIKIAPEIKKQTLELASQYLSADDARKSQKGAEVIRKLLEQDGLTAAEVDKYFGLLIQKYDQQKSSTDGSLRGELLGGMAGLCAQSAYRAEAIKKFTPLFEQALTDEANLVREAAVDGLIYIDKTRALKTLRKDSANDDSIIVRRKLMDLAGEVGGTDDLVWLVERLSAKNDGEQAWQAMLKIFKRSDTAVINEWMGKFNAISPVSQLSDEQRTAFLETAERKAVGENKAEMLKEIRKQLVPIYSKAEDYKRAAECFGFLVQQASSDQEKEAVLGQLLGVYLRWPNVKAAKDLVSNSLLEKDLEPNSVIVSSIGTFLNEASADTDPNTFNMIVTEIGRIEVSAPRPMWQKQVKDWLDRFSRPKPIPVTHKPTENK